VDRGFQRAGHDELRQFRDRLGQGQLLGDLASQRFMLGGQVPRQIQGMARAAILPRRFRKLLPQGQHRLERLRRGKLRAWPGPDIPHRHRTEPFGAAPVARLHPQTDIQQHRVGHHPAAKLDRRAVGDLLGLGRDLDDPDVGRFRHGAALEIPNERKRRHRTHVATRGGVRRKARLAIAVS
jgi:hypothetical protein